MVRSYRILGIARPENEKSPCIGSIISPNAPGKGGFSSSEIKVVCVLDD